MSESLTKLIRTKSLGKTQYLIIFTAIALPSHRMGGDTHLTAHEGPPEVHIKGFVPLL